MSRRPVARVRYVKTRNPQEIMRTGECNNCGVCCQLYKRPDAPKDSPFYAETAGYGYCNHYLPYAEQGHCAIWLKRPKECREYPRGPMDVLNKPTCSYHFFDGFGRKIDAYMDKRVRLQIVGQTREEDYPFQNKF